MPYYRRAHAPGGTFFLTLVTERRAPLFADEAGRAALREAIAAARAARPFTLDEIVLLPDHLHLLLTLPDGDADFSTRIASIKAAFTRGHLAAGGVEQPRSAARLRKRRRGVWQRWFWEHTIRDAADRARHVDYLFFNPVKHGLVPCPHLWPASSFHAAVARGEYPYDWRCVCDSGQPFIPPDDWNDACEPR